MNSGEPDQTPQNAASDLVLHCLPMYHKKDAMLIWVKFLKVLLFGLWFITLTFPGHIHFWFT